MGELSPLGEYLERHRGAVSKREAARLAGISEGRWRQVTTGRQSAGGGLTIPVNPKSSTVAAMARAVGADVATALDLAGFDPADHPDLVRPSGHDADFVTRAGSIDLSSMDEEDLNRLIADAVTEKARREGSGGSMGGDSADD